MRLLLVAMIAVGGCANTLPASEILWIQDAAKKSLGKCSAGSILPRHTLCPLLQLNESDVVKTPAKQELRVGVQLLANDEQKLETTGRAAWFFHGPDGWDELESLRPSEIAYVQFDDHPPLQSHDLLEETTMRRVLPGRGEFDLHRFTQTFRKVGWQGVVGLELLSEESRKRPPAEVSLELMRSSEPYWSR